MDEAGFWELQFYTSHTLEPTPCFRRWNKQEQGGFWFKAGGEEERMIRYLIWWHESGFEISDVTVHWVLVPE